MCTVSTDMVVRFLVDSFVVVVIGGVGSFPGAIIGGIIAGEILSLTSMFNPAYSDVMLFVVMALVLILRPQGIMGQEGRECIRPSTQRPCAGICLKSSLPSGCVRTSVV